MKKSYSLFTMLLMLAISTSLFSQQKYNSNVENTGTSCTIGNAPSFTATGNLPDPFLKFSGQRITTKDEWWCRRQEILSLFEKYVYGTKPAKPTTVTGTVTKNGTTGTVTVNATYNGKNISFSASITYPSGNGPFPAVIMYSNSGADAATIRGQGVATINYNPYDVGKEGTGRTNKQGLFYTLYGSNSSTGLLAAWAWGVSRILDVIEQSGGSNIKADAIGVTGCSRFGKGSFVAGVLDQRIALTMPVESGTGGVPAIRTIPGEGAQSLSSAYGEEPWFGDAFNSFTGNPNSCPVDMHMAVALCAPRGLLVLDNSGIANLGPKSAHLSVVAGSKVYEALGVLNNIGYHSNSTNGNHCAWRTEWKGTVEDFIKRFLLRSTTTVGATPLINPRSTATGNTNLITYTTPTLSGSLTIDGGPEPSGFVLTTTASPASAGSVTGNPATPASGRYEEGAAVSLTPVASTGWKFDSWSGDATGNEIPFIIKMSENKTVTAKFTPTADGTTNLVKDGNFPGNNLTTNWTLGQGQYYGNSAATATVSGGKVTLNITAIGAEVYQPQLVQKVVSLEQGMKYRLTFTASAAGARTMGVMLQKSSDPYTAYSQDTTYNLTTTPQTYMLEFEMTNPSDASTQLSFNVGGSTQNVTISDVNLVYIAAFTDPELTGISDISVGTSQSNLRVNVLSNSAVNVYFIAAGNETELRFYSLNGDLITSVGLQTVAGESYSHTFNPGKLPAGFYIVWMNSNGSVERSKVVIPK